MYVHVGQVIRIWGRIPFQPSGNAPPPIHPKEPYWQQLFRQQLLRHRQQQQQEAVKITPHAGMTAIPKAKVQSSASTPTTGGAGLQERVAPMNSGSDPISIWGSVPSEDSGKVIVPLHTM